MTSRKKKSAKKTRAKLKKPIPFAPESAPSLDEVYAEGLTIKTDDIDGGVEDGDTASDDALDISARDDLFGSY